MTVSNLFYLQEWGEEGVLGYVLWRVPTQGLLADFGVRFTGSGHAFPASASVLGSRQNIHLPRVTKRAQSSAVATRSGFHALATCTVFGVDRFGDSKLAGAARDPAGFWFGRCAVLDDEIFRSEDIDWRLDLEPG